MTVVASNYARAENDLYQTEPWATEALLRNFPVYHRMVWEPAAGNHKIVDVLRSHDCKVFSSDIKTYDRRHSEILDFLNGDLSNAPYHEAIITNPPYGKGNRDAVRFAERALDICRHGMVALLLTAKFDFGKTRRHLFADNPRFLAKINLVDRIQWFEGATTGTEDHAWYVWGAKPDIPTKPIILYEGK